MKRAFNFMITKICLMCRKEFKTRKKRIKFCSHRCYWKSMKGRKLSFRTKEKMRISRSGKRNPMWKGGTYKNFWGRWLVLAINNPSANSQKYIYRYRLIAEKHLGRHLTKLENIHHINGIKDDDRPENLYLFSSISEHRKYETSKNKSILKSNIV